jgi:DNA polymerase-3 subunit alpha
MSLDIHNTDKLSAFFQDARRMGLKIAPPDVCLSDADFDVRDQVIFYALGAIKGVGRPAMACVERARAERPFRDLQDFAERIDPRLVNRRCLEALARAGAFASLEPNRARAFAAAPSLSMLAASAEDDRQSQQTSLFSDQPAASAILPDAVPWGESQRLDHELGSIGFFLSGHPLESALTPELRERIVLAADREAAARERLAFDMIGVVRARVEKPARNGGRFAYVTLSDPSGEFEIMAPPEVLSASRDMLEPGFQALVRVRVRRQDEDIRFTLDTVRPLASAQIGDHEALCVRLSRDAPLEPLRELAESLRRARSNTHGRLILELPLDDDRLVTIALRGRYPIDFGAMSALKSSPGVDGVRPAGL